LDDFDLSTVTEAIMEAIHLLNREMIAAAARKLGCGISGPQCEDLWRPIGRNTFER